MKKTATFFLKVFAPKSNLKCLFLYIVVFSFDRERLKFSARTQIKHTKKEIQRQKICAWQRMPRASAYAVALNFNAHIFYD